MKRFIPYIISTLLGLSVVGSIAYASQPVFTSPQVGTSPANGFVLQTNGLNSTWVATSTLGIVSGGTPGGLNLQVQYNNAGAFGGISGAVTNGTILNLTNPLLGGATLTTSSVNGVTLTTGGATTSYLNASGAYSVPVGTTYTATYPVTLTSTAFGLAFGTTTSNTWGGTQTFTNPIVNGTLSGLIAASAGLTYATATTSATCSGTVSCTGFTIIGSSPITITGSGGGSTGLSTTSPVSSSNLLYYNATGAGSATGVATSTLTPSSPLTGSFIQIGSAGTLGLGTVGYANGGTGTTTAPQGQLLYGGTTAYQSVATSSLSISTGLTTTGTAGALVGGNAYTLKLADTAVTPGSYTNANITVDQQGRITLAANGSGGGSTGLATSSPVSAGNLLFYNATGAGSATGVATSSLSVNASISSSGTLGSQVGGTNSQLSINLTNPNAWTGLQTFTNATSTQFTCTTCYLGTLGSALNGGGFLINNIGAPVSGGDAANKTYVDNAVAGVNPAVAVKVATTQASDTSGLTYNNGVSGVGATFTGSNNTALTFDGVTLTSLSQRVLIKNDTQSPSGAFNGVYYLTQLQTAILPPILTRALDYDMPSDINNTGAIPVINGTTNGSTSWVITSSVTTVGTDPLTYAKFTINPSTIFTTAGTGLTGTGGNTVSFASIAANSLWVNATGASAVPTVIATSTLGIALSDTTGTLAVNRGGTGLTSFTGDQMLYTNHAGTAILSAATSSLSIGGNAATVTTNANMSGAVTSSGSNVTAFGTLAQGILGNPFSAATVPTALATSTLFGSTATFLTTGLVGIGSTTPYKTLSVGGDLVVGAPTAGGTNGNLFLNQLASAAGSFLAVNGAGQVIATSTPVSTPASRTIYSSTVQSTIGQVTSTTTMRTVAIPANTLNGTTGVLRVTAQFGGDYGSACYFNTIYGDGSASTTIGFAVAITQAIVINQETASSTSEQAWTSDGTSMDGRGGNPVSFGPIGSSNTEYTASHLTALDTTGKTYLGFAARTINATVCSINAITVELVSQ